jgi:hypothetical protein
VEFINIINQKNMNESAKIKLEFTKEELILINNALNEITGGAYALPDVEFQTLTGSTKAEALELLKKVSEAIINSKTAVL